MGVLDALLVKKTLPLRGYYVDVPLNSYLIVLLSLMLIGQLLYDNEFCKHSENTVQCGWFSGISQAIRIGNQKAEAISVTNAV